MHKYFPLLFASMVVPFYGQMSLKSDYNAEAAITVTTHQKEPQILQLSDNHIKDLYIHTNKEEDEKSQLSPGYESKKPHFNFFVNKVNKDLLKQPFVQRKYKCQYSAFETSPSFQKLLSVDLFQQRK